MRHGPVLRAAIRGTSTSTLSHWRSNTPDVCWMGSSNDSALDEEDLSLGTPTQRPSSFRGSKVNPTPVPEEITLYHAPEGLYLAYRPVPWFLQLAIWFTSAWISAIVTFKKLQLSWIRPLLALRSGANNSKVPWGKIWNFAFKTTVLALTVTTALQEVLLPPSRVSTQQLIRDFHLPSVFSRYDTVSVEQNGKLDSSQGVHYLLCDANSSLSSSSSGHNRTGLIYLNHGFGASSLSWIPALSPMMNQLPYRSIVAHDAPGFGFTDRSRDWMEPYTHRGSAAIGTSLLKKQQQTQAKGEKILLLGHSMGAITTLRMALELPPTVEKHIVLVNPALGVGPNQAKTKASVNTSVEVQLVPISNKWFHRLFGPLFSYVLRRAVGRPGFWKAGLQMAWGNSTRVKDSDVLRFQWPALAQGWERGMITFSRAQLLPMERTDRELLVQVLAMPKTTVSVICGGNDRVIPSSKIRSFFAPYPQIQRVGLKGLGHDPFEEDVDTFMAALKTVLGQ